MKYEKRYFKQLKIKPLAIDNIENKNEIHQFENKNQSIDIDSLRDKYTLNELR